MKRVNFDLTSRQKDKQVDTYRDVDEHLKRTKFIDKLLLGSFTYIPQMKKTPHGRVFVSKKVTQRKGRYFMYIRSWEKRSLLSTYEY